MTLTLRLGTDLERKLTQAAEEQGLSKSELVRQCLLEFLDQRGDGRLAWELGKDVFGKYGSGRTDLATNAKPIAREKIHAEKKPRGRRSARRVI